MVWSAIAGAFGPPTRGIASRISTPDRSVLRGCQFPAAHHAAMGWRGWCRGRIVLAVDDMGKDNVEVRVVLAAHPGSSQTHRWTCGPEYHDQHGGSAVRGDRPMADRGREYRDAHRRASLSVAAERHLPPAKATFDRSVEQISTIPNYRPVAFRMPCCDSMSSVSPRFFAEIFNRTTPQGQFLAIDTSVFQVFTAATRSCRASVCWMTTAEPRLPSTSRPTSRW